MVGLGPFRFLSGSSTRLRAAQTPFRLEAAALAAWELHQIECPCSCNSRCSPSVGDSTYAHVLMPQDFGEAAHLLLFFAVVRRGQRGDTVADFCGISADFCPFSVP